MKTEATIEKEAIETTKGKAISEEAHAADVAAFMDAIPGVTFKKDETEEVVEAAADVVEEELKQEAETEIEAKAEVEVEIETPTSELTKEVEPTEEEPSSSVEEPSEALEEEKEEVPPEPSELELLREQNIKLMAMLNDPNNADGLIAKLAAAPVEQQAEITGPLGVAPIAPVVAAPEPVAPTPVPVAVPIPVILNDETLANVLGDPRAFTEFVAGEVQRGRQEVLSEIGPIVANVLSVERRVSAFFAREENRDLLPLAEVVKQAAITIERQKPGVSIENLLEESAQLTRKSSGLGANLASAEVLPNGMVKIPKKPTGGVPSAAKRFARGTIRKAPETKTKKTDAPEPGSVDEQIQLMNATL